MDQRREGKLFFSDKPLLNIVLLLLVMSHGQIDLMSFQHFFYYLIRLLASLVDICQTFLLDFILNIDGELMKLSIICLGRNRTTI